MDEDALRRVMAQSKARTTDEAVDLALRFYIDRQERAARIKGLGEQ
ncbi:type II toxin-antitoxin system VapB family antitoxin [Streptomyces laurentii]